MAEKKYNPRRDDNSQAFQNTMQQNDNLFYDIDDRFDKSKPARASYDHSFANLSLEDFVQKFSNHEDLNEHLQDLRRLTTGNLNHHDPVLTQREIRHILDQKRKQPITNEPFNEVKMNFNNHQTIVTNRNEFSPPLHASQLLNHRDDGMLLQNQKSPTMIDTSAGFQSNFTFHKVNDGSQSLHVPIKPGVKHNSRNNEPGLEIDQSISRGTIQATSEEDMDSFVDGSLLDYFISHKSQADVSAPQSQDPSPVNSKYNFLKGESLKPKLRSALD